MDSSAIAAAIYDIWTSGGSLEAGLAAAFFDGRIDALCYLLTEGDDDDDEEEIVEEIVECSCFHQVDRRDSENLSYSDFVDGYLRKNEPCIITRLLDEWPAFKELNAEGKVDVDYLEAMFGEVREWGGRRRSAGRLET